MRFTLLFVILLFPCLSLAQANECITPIVICSTTDLEIDTDGIGTNEFNNPNNIVPPCYTFDRHHVWIEITMESSGTFGFDLIPEVSRADFDFAMFGPNVDCNNLGNSIRCSSTNPDNANVSDWTGLNDTETDVVEGPGPDGNGYLQELTVNAGETYLLVVDRAHGSGGFTIDPNGGTARLPDVPDVVALPPQTICDEDGNVDGLTTFDISQFDSELINGQNFVTISYHLTESDAANNINPINGSTTSTSSDQTFYVRLQNVNSECVAFTDFQISVQTDYMIDQADPIFLCDVPGLGPLDLQEVAEQELGSLANLQVSYHGTESDATAGINPLARNVQPVSGSQTYFISYYSTVDVDCRDVISIEVNVIPPKMLASGLEFHECDDDYNDRLVVFLSDYEPQLLDGTDPTDLQIEYYRRAIDRSNGIGQLPNEVLIRNGVQTFFVLVTDLISGCVVEEQFTVIIDPLPELPDPQEFIICTDVDEQIELTVPTGFANYEWSNGESGPDLSSIIVNQGGDYTVDVTGDNGCQSTTSFMVIESSAPIITDVVIDHFERGNNSLEVLVNGDGQYQYRIDQGYYQTSNRFSGLSNGFYTLTVKDNLGCGEDTEEVVILDYPRYFTPNGDGFNDFWRLEGMETFPDLSIQIFNRHGKLLKTLSGRGLGWDGTFNNEKMPSSDYWFTLNFTGHPEIRGHFSLKR